MKKLLYPLIASSLVLLVGCQQNEQSTALETQDQKLAYAVGIQFGSRLKQDFDTLDLEAFSQGFEHAFGDTERLLSEEDIVDTFKQYQQKRLAIQEAKNNIPLAKNIAEGKTFMDANAAKDGIVVLATGVQYKIINSGPTEGASPSAADTVSVHYTGTLLDGTEFDSSHRRGQPAKFPLNRVIPGWTEILQLMKPGDKWQVFIPSDSAYGSRGAGEPIGPGMTLIFDIELLAVLN